MKKLFIFFLPLFLIIFTGCSSDKTKTKYFSLIPNELNSLLTINDINPNNYNIDLNEDEYNNKNIKKSIVKIIETNYNEYSNYLKTYLNQNSFSERPLMRAITNYLENKKIEDAIIPLYNSTNNEHTVTLRLTSKNNIFAKIARRVNNIFINFTTEKIKLIGALTFLVLAVFIFSIQNSIIKIIFFIIAFIIIISFIIFAFYFSIYTDYFFKEYLDKIVIWFLLLLIIL